MNNSLDLAFCVDSTGSMSQYIAQVQTNVRSIVEQIMASEKVDIRMGLVRYRDFTDDFVTRTHPFTNSIATMKGYVDEMSAKGGGDGPEAVASGLNALLELDWRKDSTKIVVFIADAPPHGLESSGDSYPNGGPDGVDPFVASRQLVAREIIVYSVGCEPAINSYACARDFMKAVADMSGGKYISLAQANLLPQIIVGGAREELNLEKISAEVEKEVERLKSTEKFEREEELYAKVASNMQARGVQTTQLQVDDVVGKDAFENTSAFVAATCLGVAKKELLDRVLMPLARPAQQVEAKGMVPPPASSSRLRSKAPQSALSPPQQTAQTSSAPISQEQIQRLVQRKAKTQAYK